MDLKTGGKEAGDRRECGRDNAAHHQRQHHAQPEGNGSEVENVAEQGTGVDALVHDHRCEHHACTHHTADGQVGTGQQDQTADAQSQEHARRSRLQNVQDVIHRQQGHALDNRAENAQQDEDKENDDIQTVFQQELTHVEGIAVAFPFLLPLFCGGEFGQTQLIQQVIAVGEGIVLAILDLLQRGAVLELGVKLTVFIDVFLVLDQLRVVQLLQLCFMLLLQRFQLGAVAGVFLCCLRRTRGNHLVIIIFVIVGIQICRRIADQGLDLGLVGGFNGLGILELCAVLGEDFSLFGLGIVGILLYNRHVGGQGNHLIGAVDTQGVYFLLDGTDVFIDRCQQALLLVNRQDDTVLFLHVFLLPPFTDILR